MNLLNVILYFSKFDNLFLVSSSYFLRFFSGLLSRLLLRAVLIIASTSLVIILSMIKHFYLLSFSSGLLTFPIDLVLCVWKFLNFFTL